MGYLDNSSVTVDAVLTKKGREIISNGGSLNVKHFTLSDTGVDYTLWNAGHESGSAYYGDAIENLPQVEALSHGQYALRNKLVTLGRDTEAMPALEAQPSSHTFTTLTDLNLSVNLVGFTAAPGATGTAGMHLLIPDTNIVTSLTGNAVDVTGNALSFITEQDIPSARVYELLGGGPNYTFTISPASNLNADKTVTLTFIDILTGTYVTAQLTVNANLQPQSRVITNPVG